MASRGTLLDWVATGAATSGVLASLLVHDLLQRVAIRFGPRPHQRVVSNMARWINRAAGLTGARIVARGLEHVDPRRNYLVVMNHQSLLDISMASQILARLMPRYVSKIELGHGIPGVSYNLTHGGSALIDRRDPAQAHRAIVEIGKRVADEALTVVLFPEGTRSRTGALAPFKVGGLRTLVRQAPGVPVLPVTRASYGGSRMFARGIFPLRRNVELGFVVHPAVSAPDPEDEAAFAAFVADLEETVASALPPEDARGGARELPRRSAAPSRRDLRVSA